MPLPSSDGMFGGPGKPPKNNSNGSRAFTMTPEKKDGPYYDQGTFQTEKGGALKGRTFRTEPIPKATQKKEKQRMYQEYKSKVRTNEDYKRGKDSLITSGQAKENLKAFKKSQVKSTMRKIKKSLPKGGKGMWGPMSACGTKGCK